jgi:hypothetical protein
VTQELDSISQALDAATPMALVPRPEVEMHPDVTEDFTSARENMHEMIKQTMEALPGMFSLMREAQSDKMYQAGASLLKVAAELQNQLVTMSREQHVRKESKNDPPHAPTIHQTAVFIGSTEDYLRQKAEEAKIVSEQ